MLTSFEVLFVCRCFFFAAMPVISLAGGLIVCRVDDSVAFVRRFTVLGLCQYHDNLSLWLCDNTGWFLWEWEMLIDRLWLTLGLLLMVGRAQAACELPKEYVALEGDVAWAEVVEGAPQVSEGVQVLNVWALWCAPCREELPLLRALYEEGGVAVQLLHLGEITPEVREMVATLEVEELPLSAVADGAILGRFGAYGVPLSVVFVDGKASYKLNGILQDVNPLVTFANCLAETDALY